MMWKWGTKDQGACGYSVIFGKRRITTRPLVFYHIQPFPEFSTRFKHANPAFMMVESNNTRTPRRGEHEDYEGIVLVPGLACQTSKGDSKHWTAVGIRLSPYSSTGSPPIFVASSETDICTW